MLGFMQPGTDVYSVFGPSMDDYETIAKLRRIHRRILTKIEDTVNDNDSLNCLRYAQTGHLIQQETFLYEGRPTQIFDGLSDRQLMALYAKVEAVEGRPLMVAIQNNQAPVERSRQVVPPPDSLSQEYRVDSLGRRYPTRKLGRPATWKTLPSTNSDATPT